MRNDIVATAVVPHQKLSDAHVDLATAHRKHLDLPDVRRVRVAVPSLHGAPEPARSRSPSQAGRESVLPAPENISGLDRGAIPRNSAATSGRRNGNGRGSRLAGVVSIPL